MIRWILSKIAGFLLPSLLSSFLKSSSTERKENNSVDIQFKILDESLGRDIALPKFQTPGSAAVDIRTNIKESIILDSNESFLFTTGFSIHINNPEYAAFILPRSGLGHKFKFSSARVIKFWNKKRFKSGLFSKKFRLFL